MKQSFDFDWFKVKWLAGYGWILERRPAVVVVPIAPDDRVWLIRLHRIPTGTTSWELPGGAIDEGENAVAAGLRELEEESSLIAKGGGRLLSTPLHLAPGMGPFPHLVVVASHVVPRGRRPVPQLDEGITAVRSFERAKVGSMLRGGSINVQATISALAVSGWLDGTLKPGRKRLLRKGP